jgi:hypothetical protein
VIRATTNRTALAEPAGRPVLGGNLSPRENFVPVLSAWPHEIYAGRAATGNQLQHAPLLGPQLIKTNDNFIY